MPTTYQIVESGDPVHAIVRAVMLQYHRDLVEVELTCTVMMAWAAKDDHGEPLAPALKHHGWPVAGYIKINNPKDRAEGKNDVTIFLDADQWEALSEESQRALIGHELYHLIVRRDKDDNVMSDDVGRPKLKMRPHDWELTGFEEIARRYGNDALEVQEFRAVVGQHGQLLMPWGDDMAGRPAQTADIKLQLGDQEFDLRNDLHRKVLQAGLDVVKGKGASEALAESVAAAEDFKAKVAKEFKKAGILAEANGK